MRRFYPIVLIFAAGTLACNLPRDAEDTLERVRGGTMRVGVILDPPWTTLGRDSSAPVGGIEGEFVQRLARDLNANVVWFVRGESDLLTDLRHRELDLVIGGLTASSPWKAEVAFTRPYYTDSVATGVAARDAPRSALEGLTIAVEGGDPAIGEIRKKKAIPRVVRDLGRETGPVAAPTWMLERLERRRIGPILQETPHVLAVVPGENAWLMHVEGRLKALEPSVPVSLRSAGP